MPSSRSGGRRRLRRRGRPAIYLKRSCPECLLCIGVGETTGGRAARSRLDVRQLQERVPSRGTTDDAITPDKRLNACQSGLAPERPSVRVWQRPRAITSIVTRNRVASTDIPPRVSAAGYDRVAYLKRGGFGALSKR